MIDAPGAGILQVDDPEIPVRKAQWRERFRLEPRGVMTADNLAADVQISIEGDIRAFMTDGGQFEAESVAAILSPESPGADQPPTLVPNQVNMTGDVRIDTAALAAVTQQVRLFFVAEPDPQTAGAQTAGPQPATPTIRQWVVLPGETTQTVDPVSRPRPTVHGDAVFALLRRNDSGISVKDLTVNGSVKVTHQINSGGQTLPAKLTGERLRLKDAGGEDILQLESSPQRPARFDLGDGFFIGPQIQVRPSDNTVWINDAGEFQMPTAVLPTGLTGSAGGDTRWTKPPHCRWNGEMIFDGGTAVLSDGVDLTASLRRGGETWDLHMVGDRLQLQLAEEVQMRDVRAVRGASVYSISMLQERTNVRYWSRRCGGPLTDCSKQST